MTGDVLLVLAVAAVFGLGVGLGLALGASVARYLWRNVDKE